MNTISEQLKGYLLQYVEGITRRSKGNKYDCPLCGSGSGPNGTGAFSISSGGEHWKCFACNKSGNIFDLIGHIEHLPDYNLQLKKATELFITIMTPIQQQETYVDFSPFIAMTFQAINKTNYPQKRGFNRETIEFFNLGYFDGTPVQQNLVTQLMGYNPFKHPALIIPYPGIGYFIARVIEPNGEHKYIKPLREKAGPEPLFNLKALYNKNGHAVFITEGQLDAISIMQAGGEAVAIGGQGQERIIKQLLDKSTDNPLIIAWDNDTTGIKKGIEFEASLKSNGFITFRAEIGKEKGYKDANEYLQKDPDGLTQEVHRAMSISDPKQRYLKTSTTARLHDFIAHNSAAIDTPCIPTGFNSLDKALDGGLYEGLYIIGAASSLGKTTFSIQIIDNIAKSGRDVLFFSLEMSADEIIAKNISRLTYELCGGLGHAKTTREITDYKRYADYTQEEIELIDAATKEYREYADRFYIIEGFEDINVKHIREAAEKHIIFTKKHPVILVDYLQMLTQSNKWKNDKQNTDYSVLELKRISRDFKIPVIAISSFNRMSYYKPADKQAFKESGVIEYSTDVLIALQPVNMLPIDRRGGGESENTQKMNECLRSEVRRAELIILKNRNGAAMKKVAFQYQASFNYFSEITVDDCNNEIASDFDNQKKEFNAPPLDNTGRILLGRLLKWRLEAASKRGWPNYMIATNNTLALIASLQPKSPEELLRVHGMGKIKVEDFGKEIISIITSAKFGVGWEVERIE